MKFVREDFPVDFAGEAFAFDAVGDACGFACGALLGGLEGDALAFVGDTFFVVAAFEGDAFFGFALGFLAAGVDFV